MHGAKLVGTQLTWRVLRVGDLRSVSVHLLPTLECLLTAFKDRADDFLRAGRINRSSIPDNGYFAGATQRDDQLGITENSDVGVVRDDDDLPVLLDAPQRPNNRLVDELAIEIVFRLIDD